MPRGRKPWRATHAQPCRPPAALEIGRVLACIAVAALAALALVWWSPAHAEDTDARVPESPYFHVHSDDPSIDATARESWSGV